MLGEFQLRTLRTAEEAPKYQYYGHADLERLNAVALVVQNYYRIVAQECADVLSFNYQRVQQSQANTARVSAVKNSKAKVVNTLGWAGAGYAPQDTYYYRAQERMRYFLMAGSAAYVCLGGRTQFLGRVHKANASNNQQQRNAATLGADPRGQLPAAVTKLALVVDACARLPARFGTREDICELCAASAFIDTVDPKFVGKITCALDRMRLVGVDSAKTAKLATFSAGDKLWTACAPRLKWYHEVHPMPDGKPAEPEPFPRDLDDYYARPRPLGRTTVTASYVPQMTTMGRRPSGRPLA